MSHDLIIGDEGHTSTFQVVIPAIEHASHSGEFVKVPGERVVNKLFLTPPCFAGELVELGLNIGGELNFHVSSLGRSRAGVNQHLSRTVA